MQLRHHATRVVRDIAPGEMGKGYLAGCRGAKFVGRWQLENMEVEIVIMAQTGWFSIWFGIV